MGAGQCSFEEPSATLGDWRPDCSKYLAERGEALECVRAERAECSTCAEHSAVFLPEGLHSPRLQAKCDTTE